MDRMELLRRVFGGRHDWDMTYHPLRVPVSCSKFGRAKSSCFGAGGSIAASAETLTIRTRVLDPLEAAVDSRSGSSVLVSRKWAR